VWHGGARLYALKHRKSRESVWDRKDADIGQANPCPIHLGVPLVVLGFFLTILRPGECGNMTALFADCMRRGVPY